ncbi:MAG: trypsin-like peptidase domain-containing protein [Oscillospiraceae bacterium]|nr:trypsin-like peptidase domain-containing protein [Oscillospiraceae bacterium]
MNDNSFTDPMDQKDENPAQELLNAGSPDPRDVYSFAGGNEAADGGEEMPPIVGRGYAENNTDPLETQAAFEEVKAQEPFNPYAPPKDQPAAPFQPPYQPPMNQNPQKPYEFPQPPVFTQPQQPQPQPEKSGKGGKIVIAALVICLLVAVAFVVKTLMPEKSDVNKATTAGSAVTTTGEAPSLNNVVSTTQTAQSDSVNSIWVAEKVRPVVVGVMVYQSGQLAGEGSGVLWAKDSTGEYTYVVTCAHVIEGKGYTYGVLTLDGDSYEAEYIAADTRTDIGVLKIKAKDLPLAEIGDSSSLKVGEPIYAIGNPGGSEYFGSITNGIVSAIDRSVSATYTMTCIQHNAAINPGNSGGALVNTAGQIVGINSSKIASTDYEGMGFAVPTSIAKPVVDALIQYKYVPNRPKLGIEYAPVSAYQLYSMVVSIKDLPKGSLVIAGISKDSSLAGTKAQVGDLIIGVNGKDMDDSSVLLDLIDTGAVGDQLTLTLCRIEQRSYKTTTFDVTITLVEDKGSSTQEEETTTQQQYQDGYYYGGADNFEDFFENYFGF